MDSDNNKKIYVLDDDFWPYVKIEAGVVVKELFESSSLTQPADSP